MGIDYVIFGAILGVVSLSIWPIVNKPKDKPKDEEK